MKKVHQKSIKYIDKSLRTPIAENWFLQSIPLFWVQKLHNITNFYDLNYGAT